MNEKYTLTEQFSEKARAVSAVVEPVQSLDQALDYAIGLCPDGGTLAAPGLDADVASALGGKAEKRGIRLVESGLREHAPGVDVGLGLAEAGLADTGTLVFDSSNEDQRLASMICDAHVAVVRARSIVPESGDLADELRKKLAAPGSYTAFITGASRTADIERVLALGVHGPLELHILVLEERSHA